MENYLQWTLTKDVRRLKLKEGTVPHRFECQGRNVQSPIERKRANKRKHLSLIKEALSSYVASTSAKTEYSDQEITTEPDFSCQVHTKKAFKCKKARTNIQINSIACSSIKNENS